MAENNYAIELSNIKKYFGEVKANDGIDLTLRKGEILALLGENGSGKTTLMNMLSGIYKPDGGTIRVSGQEVVISTPEDSKRLGIGMVHQHFKLIEKFSAADNIYIAAENETAPILTAERYKKIEDLCERFGFELDVRKPVSEMSVSEKQTVEILKVLYNGADILILDEPTATLTLQEIVRLFAILRKMRDAGAAIIIITHKLGEVLEISDRVTILRHGKSITTVETASTNQQELTELMVGRAVDLAIAHPICPAGEKMLSIEDLTIIGPEGIPAIDGVSLDVHAGEIVGIAGVSGCGQKELCEAIAGLQQVKSGSILYRGEHIEDKTPREIISRGVSMSFIPEDRLGMGLAASMSITDNMMLKNYCDGKGPFVNRKRAAETAKTVVKKLGISTPGIDKPVSRLSGGNVQKVLLGREMESQPQLLITAYPVRGLDINSSYNIYDILNTAKRSGTAILFVGEDLDVMLQLCDRIAVLCHGKLTGVLSSEEATKEKIGLLMTDANADTDYSSADGALSVSGGSFEQTAFAQKNESVPSRKKRQPPVRMVKRDAPKPLYAAMLNIASVLIALIIAGMFVLINGVNPISYFATVFAGCFKNVIYLRAFIRTLIPLLITSIGIAYAFKMKFWNIGANGQFIVGSIAATTVAFALGNSLPQWLTLLIMAAAAFIFSGLFGLIPALCKIKLGTSETLITLMLNYIAFYVLTYLKNLMFFRKVSETGSVYRPDFKQLPENAWLYEVEILGVSVDISLFIALALVIITYVYFRYTKQGYELSVVGISQPTAHYAGMKVSGIIFRTMFLSSAIIGLAGMFQVTGSATGHTLTDGITSDVGWTGIIVAWLAKLNPLGILVVSALMSILEKGTSVAESTFAISAAASDVIQGIILFSVLAVDFFSRYKLCFDIFGKGGKAK